MQKRKFNHRKLADKFLLIVTTEKKELRKLKSSSTNLYKVPRTPHACTQACKHERTRTSTRTHTRAHAHARTYVHTHARTHTRAHTRTHAHTHTRTSRHDALIRECLSKSWLPNTSQMSVHRCTSKKDLYYLIVKLFPSNKMVRDKARYQLIIC